ncbi:MAG: 3D domain-containing protein [Bryobacteraceae bacterium]|jgi:3D (Asp-Asp-Asp) domain-containing protein
MAKGSACFIGTIVLLFSSLPASADQRTDGPYTATAYAQQGVTASGEYTHRHVVAADPDILPLGTRIKVTRAGRYSGEYVVADTGGKIQGRKLDIFLPDEAACLKFGKRKVTVKVIQLGDGTKSTTKQADHAVKEDVSKDIQKNAVGNAATEDDWAAKNRAADKARRNTPNAMSPETPTTAQPSPK